MANLGDCGASTGRWMLVPELSILTPGDPEGRMGRVSIPVFMEDLETVLRPVMYVDDPFFRRLYGG